MKNGKQLESYQYSTVNTFLNRCFSKLSNGNLWKEKGNSPWICKNINYQIYWRYVFGDDLLYSTVHTDCDQPHWLSNIIEIFITDLFFFKLSQQGPAPNCWGQNGSDQYSYFTVMPAALVTPRMPHPLSPAVCRRNRGCKLFYFL